MRMGFLRLVFAVFWVLVAWFAFYRRQQEAAAGGGGFAPSNWDVAIILALLMAVWNVVRWYLARPRALPPENALERREPRTKERERSEEYNPEFDFGASSPRKDE